MSISTTERENTFKKAQEYQSSLNEKTQLQALRQIQTALQLETTKQELAKVQKEFEDFKLKVRASTETNLDQLKTMTKEEDIVRVKGLAEGYSDKCRQLHQMIAEKWENQVLVVKLRTDLRFYEGMLQTCLAAIQMMERHLSGLPDGEPTIIVPWLSDLVSGLDEVSDWREKGGLHG